MANFDPLANMYRGLEVVAFGRDLERARFAWIDALADRDSILILGEGDGRFLETLLPRTNAARIHCIDSSRAMLDKARARIAGQPGADRVTFECADAQAHALAPAAYDAVVTLFFLDCFSPSDAGPVVSKIARALRPGAVWLFADFVLPERGPRRWRAQMWLATLYAFFRWKTGLKTRELPPSERLIEAEGFTPIRSRRFQWGLLHSVQFQRSVTAA